MPNTEIQLVIHGPWIMVINGLKLHSSTKTFDLLQLSILDCCDGIAAFGESAIKKTTVLSSRPCFSSTSIALPRLSSTGTVARQIYVSAAPYPAQSPAGLASMEEGSSMKW